MSIDELKLINSIAQVYADLEQYAQAITIHEQLLAYVEHHCDEVMTSDFLQLVLFNYAQELCLDKQYRKSIEFAKQGQKACILYDQCHCLPGYFSIMAECHYFLGQRGESEECYKVAYYLYTALEQFQRRQELAAAAYERLGLTF